MKYKLFITFLFWIHFVCSMEHTITSTKYELEFDQTIGKVLAKQKGIDAEGIEALRNYRKSLNGNSMGDTSRLARIGEKYVSFENVSEYNKMAAELVKLWFNEKRLCCSYHKDKFKRKTHYLYQACHSGMKELMTFFLDKIKPKDKKFTLYITVIEGWFAAKCHAGKIKEKQMQQTIKNMLTAHYFNSLRILHDAQVSPVYKYWPQTIYPESPLTYAAYKLKPEFVAFFLTIGADINNNYNNQSTINIFEERIKEENGQYKSEIEKIQNLFARHTAWNNFLKHPDHKNNYYFSLLPKEILGLFEKKFLYGVEI